MFKILIQLTTVIGKIGKLEVIDLLLGPFSN